MTRLLLIISQIWGLCCSWKWIHSTKWERFFRIFCSRSEDSEGFL